MGKSFKTGTPKNYIKENAFQYNIKGETSTKNTIEIKGDLQKKTIHVDGSLVKKISKHIAFLPTVIHTPEEAVLETKINHNRNQSINKNISLYSPQYLKNIQKTLYIAAKMDLRSTLGHHRDSQGPPRYPWDHLGVSLGSPRIKKGIPRDPKGTQGGP